jgi:hypothetical protein
VTGPTEVGMIVNVCAAEELLNVRTTGADRPPPEGVMVIVPLELAFGVTVNVPDGPPMAPPPGPVKLNVLAGATGVNEFEIADEGLVPYALVAVTEHVYAVPFVSPVTVKGLLDPVVVAAPGLQVAVYAVIGEPPVDGTENATVAEPFPAVTVPMPGAAGDVL